MIISSFLFIISGSCMSAASLMCEGNIRLFTIMVDPLEAQMCYEGNTCTNLCNNYHQQAKGTTSVSPFMFYN